MLVHMTLREVKWLRGSSATLSGVLEEWYTTINGLAQKTSLPEMVTGAGMSE